MLLRGVGAFVCFFFQAEDGIRDPLVTGVKTCALPISRSPADQSACADHTRRAACAAHPTPIPSADWTVANPPPTEPPPPVRSTPDRSDAASAAAGATRRRSASPTPPPDPGRHPTQTR